MCRSADFESLSAPFTFLPELSLFPVCVCRRLKGGYRALDMGLPHEAMVDMTGGVAEVLNISLLPRDLPAFLKDLLSKGALINCANCQVHHKRSTC